MTVLDFATQAGESQALGDSVGRNCSMTGTDFKGSVHDSTTSMAMAMAMAMAMTMTMTILPSWTTPSAAKKSSAAGKAV